MRLFQTISFITAICISYFCVQAQSYSTVHYDTKDGLPSGTVYDITQDTNGFMWFGTENGLCRFDGKNFKTYTTKDGLPDNAILKAHGDNNGRILINPFTHGIYVMQNDSFFKLQIPEEYKLDLSTLNSFINKKEKVFIGGTEGLYLLEGNKLHSMSERFTTRDSKFVYLRIYDTLLVLQTRDSLIYMPDSGARRSYYSPGKMGDQMALDQYGRKTELKIPKYDYMTLMEYFKDSLADFYTNNVLNILNISSGNIIYSIRIEKLSDAFIDNEDNLWVATLGNGIYRYPSFKFTNLNFEGKNEIFSLVQFNDHLMVGADNSRMFNINLKENGMDYTTDDFSSFIKASGNTQVRVSKANRLYVLRADGNDLYIGTDGFLLRKTGSSAPVFKQIHPIKDIDIGDKNILLCTSYYVFLLDKKTLSIQDTLLRQRATCGIAYQDGYYVGTLGGLVKIDRDTKKINPLSNLSPSLSSRIVALKKGIDDDLWVATSGAGLVQYKNDRIVRILTEKDGLTTDICTSLFIDGKVIWLGTSKGLNRIETGKEKLSITRITSANGLAADFINSIAVTDSNVYAGTAAGITKFSKDLLTEKSICILQILQVSENNYKLKNDSSYSFPYNALNIQIDFTAISFKSAGDITYYYKLDGLDNNWNTTTSNFVNFSTLQPNDYTFLLKAVNKFGVESATKSIRISILPPWWQTWLFRTAAIGLLILLVLLIYSYNIRTVRRKEETKREIEARFAALEQKALQAQMNPHFIFNSLNSIQTFILNLDVEGANNYLTNFASLIRQTLDNSMHPLISIASEIKYLETYLRLEKLRFREKFRYEILVDETIDQNNTVLPGMLLQPYIENSLRHGIQHRKDNEGLITLSVSKDGEDAILYTITDNGVGRKKAEELKSARHIEYQSRGTSINQNRIAAINNQFKSNIREQTEDITDASGMVAGTRVSVWIPRLK